MLQYLLLLLLGQWNNVLATLVPVPDPISVDKYMINYLAPHIWDRTFVGNETALLVGRIFNVGSQMSCYVSHHSQNANFSDKLEDEKVEEYLTTILEESVKIITVSVSDCLSYFSGFWNYKYCPNGTLSQFNGDPKTSPLNYVLARTEQRLDDRTFRLLYNDFGYYISETIGSGDICDMTRQPRAVEIQYVCGPAAGSASIQWVREHKTCHYEVQIAVPSLCSIELLSKNGDKKFSTPLYCSKSFRDIQNTVDIVTGFEPIFMGNELYLLKPVQFEEGTKRALLLYTGTLLTEGRPADRENKVLTNKFNQAIGRMFLQELILSPDGLPFSEGDKVSWCSEVVDLSGKYLTTVQFNVSSSSKALVNFDPHLDLKQKDNFLNYKRYINPNKMDTHTLDNEQGKPLFESQDSLDHKDMIKFILVDGNVEIGDQSLVDETEYLLEDLLTPEQIADLLEKLGNSRQKDQNANENKIKADDRADTVLATGKEFGTAEEYPNGNSNPGEEKQKIIHHLEDAHDEL